MSIIYHANIEPCVSAGAPAVVAPAAAAAAAALAVAAPSARPIGILIDLIIRIEIWTT